MSQPFHGFHIMKEEVRKVKEGVRKVRNLSTPSGLPPIPPRILELL
jgi:hypothetical protein